MLHFLILSLLTASLSPLFISGGKGGFYQVRSILLIASVLVLILEHLLPKQVNLYEEHCVHVSPICAEHVFDSSSGFIRLFGRCSLPVCWLVNVKLHSVRFPRLINASVLFLCDIEFNPLLAFPHGSKEASPWWIRILVVVVVVLAECEGWCFTLTEKQSKQSHRVSRVAKMWLYPLLISRLIKKSGWTCANTQPLCAWSVRSRWWKPPSSVDQRR